MITEFENLEIQRVKNLQTLVLENLQRQTFANSKNQVVRNLKILILENLTDRTFENCRAWKIITLEN